MKEIIATEKILSPIGHITAIKYHYEDGSTRTVPRTKEDHESNQVSSTLKNLLKDDKKQDN